MNTDSFESFFELLDPGRSKPEHSTRFTKFSSKQGEPSPRQCASIFDKLHYESVELKNKHLRRQFESKKKKEYEERASCTFRPSSNAITVIQQPQAFYQKNIDWLERKNRQMRRLQCQKAEDRLKGMTLTPKINRRAREDKENKVCRTHGVNEFLHRYKKAREQRKYKEQRMVMPNGHCWNIRRGLSQLRG